MRGLDSGASGDFEVAAVEVGEGGGSDGGAGAFEGVIEQTTGRVGVAAGPRL
jgi:hypothetical protein